MDKNVGGIIINFVLKGGPPWGFRIKQRATKVIISKVNCGGRAYKSGLKVNDEIVAVNNLEVDKHPLTLVRQADNEAQEDTECNQLTKLDFTYQLIKHTLNRQLHLTVRRHSDSDIVQPCLYCIEDEGTNDAYQLTEYQSQSEEEILSPSEDQDFGESGAGTLVKAIAELGEPQAGPSRTLIPSDLTPSDIPFAISPQSEESDMSSLTKPSFKARAPKNIWSPGSTTTSSSDSTSTTIPVTTASATQTTPTRADAKASTLPHGFRPVTFSPSEHETSTPLNINTSLTNSHAESSLLSPSSVSETSVDISKPQEHRSPPESPIQKFWTLPRHSSKEDYEIHGIKQVVTDKPPPPEAKFLYETPVTKYYTLPTSVAEKSTITVPAPKKYDGIGPTDDSGIPLSLRTGVKEEFREDWYKTMFKRLHKFDKPKTDLDEPLRIKFKTHKPEYRFDPKYFEDEKGIAPRDIADYEPGHSSISLREKQMESATEKSNDTHVIEEEQREKEMQEDHERHRRPVPIPYHRNCVFNALTSTNGYESDSSYIIKKKEPKTVPTPASRSTYCAVQRGDIDIPFSGLQKPAPHPRSHKVGPCPPPRTLEDNVLLQVPPRRPPSPQTLSDRAIDEWQKQTNSDFNDIYQALQMKQETHTDQQLPCIDTNYLLPSFEKSVNKSPFRSDRSDRSVKSESPLKQYEENKSILDSLIQQIEAEADAVDSQSKGGPVEDSKHKFDEDQVNIHYRSPIRQLVKDEVLNDDELVKRQREQMRRFYENEFERRYMKESQDSAQRRHHFTPKQEHIVHLDRYQRAYSEKDSSQLQQNLLARVLFDFHAVSSREISVKKGDIVIVQRSINHNWVEVEDAQSGLKGLVPRNYLDFEKEGSAKAKYDFEAKTPVEIPLKKSEIVRLFRKVDDNWYEGVNSKGDVGIFPCSYVETIKSPLYLQLNNNYPSYRPLSPPQQYSRSLSPVCPPSPSRQMNGTAMYKEKGAPTTSQQKLYRVLYPYKPQQADELELLAGDILTVTMHCDDGWFVGHSTLTGQYGTFPGNYVELLM